MSLTGHKTDSVFRRYAITDAEVQTGRRSEARRLPRGPEERAARPKASDGFSERQYKTRYKTDLVRRAGDA
jgi:hypothetical protein